MPGSMAVASLLVDQRGSDADVVLVSLARSEPNHKATRPPATSLCMDNSYWGLSIKTC